MAVTLLSLSNSKQVMHPKCMADLAVSDGQIEDATKAFNWFALQFENLMKAESQARKSYRESLKAQIGKLEAETQVR
jgi:hypothetical protein